MSASLSHHGAKSVATARREHSALRAPPPDKIRHQRQARACDMSYDADLQLSAASLTASKSAPHLSWRSSGQAKLAAIEKNWELHIPLRPDLRKQLKQQQSETWRDATQVRYDETGPRSNHGPVRRRSTAAPNPAAGFASAVLSCELSVARGAQPRAGAPRRPDSVIVLTVVCA